MLDFILSLMYPKRCVRCRKSGVFICDNCFATIQFLEYQLCSVCQKGSVDGLTHPKCRTRVSLSGIISSVAYKGIVKKLIYQFKYPPHLSALKDDLGSLLYEGLIQQETFMRFVSQDGVVITSVPLHKSRLRERGYNQSELLGKYISVKLEIPYVNLLRRKINTKPQFKLKKDARKENMRGAFEIDDRFKNKIKGKYIVIVDDITTTGATLRECGKVLRKSGAKAVLGVTLAHEG